MERETPPFWAGLDESHHDHTHGICRFAHHHSMLRSLGGWTDTGKIGVCHICRELGQVCCCCSLTRTGCSTYSSTNNADSKQGHQAWPESSLTSLMFWLCRVEMAPVPVTLIAVFYLPRCPCSITAAVKRVHRISK